MPPESQTLDFTEADFEQPSKSSLDFSEEDFAPKRPSITPSPYEAQRMASPMGPFGPLNPQEVLSLPQVLKAPGAALSQAGIIPGIQDAMRISMQSLGIDPAIITPEAPGPTTVISPTPMEEAFPNFMQGVNTSVDQMVAGLADPTLAPLLLAKPAQALFGAQAAADIPESVQAMAQATSPQELGAATGQTFANIGIGASVAGHLLPRARRAAVETLTEKGLPDATEERIQQENIPIERPGNGPGGAPAEAGVGGGVQPAAPVEKKAPLPLTKEEQSFLDLGKSDIGVPVEVHDQPLGANEPFAKQIATINRERGSILINPAELSAWLKDVPEARRQLAVNSLLSEERIHLGVDDASALEYWNGLTSLEKAIEKRRYSGNWKARGLDEIDMGHEAVRFRLQQLARMTPREIAEANLPTRIGMQAITALENVVRKIRENLGTKASVQQQAILARIQENLAIAKGGTPGAIRKGRPETSQQDIMYLPPVPKDAALERNVFPAPTAVAIEAAATEHFNEAIKAGKAPSFEDFSDQLKGQYGSGISKDAIYYTWQDAMMKRLMNAPGAELDTMLEQLGLKKETDYRKTPDAMQMPPTQMEIGQVARDLRKSQWRTAKAWRHKFGPQMQRRYTAIGAIIDKLTREQGEPPKRVWERKDIGPEDIAQRFNTVEGAQVIKGESGEEITPYEVDTSPMFRTFAADEIKDPAKVAEIATRGAAVDATGKEAPPRSVSKNLIALRSPTGKVVLVSVWKDPRTGPRVTNVEVPSAESQHLGKILPTYRPMAVMTLREPAKGFHKVFANQEEFNRYFGDLAIEGTPGIKTGMFTGPEAGVVETQAGIRGAGAPPPAQAGRPPEFTEKDFESPTATELTTPQRAPIRPGRFFYRSPRPEAPSGEKLSPEARQAVEQRAAEAFPSSESAISAPSYGKPTGRIIEKGKPAPLGPGWPLRAGLEGTREGRRTPAAIRKNATQLMDDAKQGFKDVLMRAKGKADVYRLADATDHMADVQAAEARESIRVASRQEMSQLPLGQTKRQTLRQIEEEAKMVREAAMARIAVGGGKNLLPKLDKLLDKAESRARMWESDPDAAKAREGKKDLEYIAKLRERLKYAEDHWNDPQFKATAKKASEELANMLKLEESMGKTIVERENYDPGIYEGDFWNPSFIKFYGKKLLGRSYRMPRTFNNAYEAIASGPYRLATLDIADRVGHRLHQGYKWVEKEAWYDAIKSIRDRATQKPIAVDAVPVFKNVTDPDTQEVHRELVGYKSPAPGYETLHGKPIAVLTPYMTTVKWATSPSAIETLPGGKAALVANQILKHNVILLWDSFHPGRLAQYATALAGFGKVGYQGGEVTLRLRPEDIPKALKSGMISQKAADWALGKITIKTPRGDVEVTRHELVREAISQGFNAKRYTDALYKEAIQNIPYIGEAWHKVVGPYNNWLFDQFIPGLMAETMVTNFEKLNHANPNVPHGTLLRDVIKDTNTFYGNMGRQGIWKSRTMQDVGRLLLLAPLWQEGLVQKELRFATRLAGGAARGVGIPIPYRKGLPPLGALGGAMGKGLFTYFVGTQIANYISRGKPTWQNPEPEHKLDAWIHVPGADEKTGFWLSPLSVFAEVTHDLIRYAETKPRAWDAVQQIGANRASPLGKLALILATGESPQHQYYSKTPGLLYGAASQVIPGLGASPISFSVPGRQLAHAVAPSLVDPNQPGAFVRWGLASLGGTKVEVPQSAGSEVNRLVQRFMDSEGLTKETGWMQRQTDDPSYSKLRSAIRSDNPAQAKRMLDSIRKTHTDDQILKAMQIWEKRPWTGSLENDIKFRFWMNDREAELFSKAQEEKMETLSKFYELLMKD